MTDKEKKEKQLADGCKKLGLELEVHYVNKQKNVPDTAFTGGKPTTFTIHETANPDVGADARMHRNFVANGGGSELASFTLCVDSKRAVLICDLTKATYHAGTAKGNSTSGSVETCINADGDWTKTKDNLAKLTAAWLNIWDLPVSAVVQHNIWYGKNCPMLLRQRGWGEVIQAVTRYLAKLKQVDDVVVDVVVEGGEDLPRNFLPVTNRILYGEFRKFFEANGDIPIFGFPLTDTTQELIAGTVYPFVQWFERARMEWHPDLNKVLLGLVGTELLQAKGRQVQPNVEISPLFKDFYKNNGGLPILGLAIEGERDELINNEIYKVQYFERARLEFNTHTEEITRGRVGAEVREALIASVTDVPPQGAARIRATAFRGRAAAQRDNHLSRPALLSRLLLRSACGVLAGRTFA